MILLSYHGLMMPSPWRLRSGGNHLPYTAKDSLAFIRHSWDRRCELVSKFLLAGLEGNLLRWRSPYRSRYRSAPYAPCHVLLPSLYSLQLRPICYSDSRRAGSKETHLHAVLPVSTSQAKGVRSMRFAAREVEMCHRALRRSARSSICHSRRGTRR
jgi:hypothetical protein